MIEVKRPLNPSSIVRIVVENRGDGYVAIESQSTWQKAVKARDILAKAGVIVLLPDITWIDRS